MTQLFKIYLQLGGSVFLGWILGKTLPKIYADYLGKFLFWIGVPISIVVFVRKADLSGQIWLAPFTAWMAIFLGLISAWLWIKFHPKNFKDNPAQGSFLLTSMVGNTGYMGYPVILGLVNSKYFAWALFYDLMGTVIGAYGLGVFLAAKFTENRNKNKLNFFTIFLHNPALASFFIGLIVHDYQLPNLWEKGLQIFAWIALTLSLLLIGMRLSEITVWQNVPQVLVSLTIKMLFVPLILGLILLLFPVPKFAHLVLVLQMGMPPAFATLVIAEGYDLDRQFTVTALAISAIAFLFTLPLWLLLFG
jgi:malate permease and related proteins